MKTYGGMDVHIHTFSTSELVGVEWLPSRPGRFTPGERAPRFSFDTRLGGPQDQQGTVAKFICFIAQEAMKMSDTKPNSFPCCGRSFFMTWKQTAFARTEIAGCSLMCRK
jgi:hypothetical protein